MVIAAFAAVTVPFYLWDRDDFSPTHQISKLEPAFPLAAETALVLALALACGCALVVWRRRAEGSGFRAVLGSIAVVQAFLFAVSALLAAADYGDVRRTLVFVHNHAYGLQFLFAGLLAAWPATWRQEELRARDAWLDPPDEGRRDGRVPRP